MKAGALSTREVEALSGSLDEPWTVLLAVLGYTGMRPGEALGPRWGDVHEQTVRVGR